MLSKRRDKIISDEEKVKFGQTWIKFFRDSGCRLLVHQNTPNDFYMENVSGNLGIALERGFLGFEFDEGLAAKDFLTLPKISVSGYCGESVDLAIHDSKIGSWSYFIFPSIAKMDKSQLFDPRAYTRVPYQFMKELGVLLEE
ncbi:MAG: hypothetical protein AABX17_02625 [Nanoarchaeota archaeon]